MAKLAPAYLAAIAFAIFGAGLVVSAFLGASFAAVRLFAGLGLLVVAMVTSGLQALATGGGTREDQEGT
jgi:hypothetical protein